MLDANDAHEATFTEHALPIGAVLSGNKFTITGHLGAGGFGITYRAQDNVLGRTIVIKECYPEDFCIREGNHVFARSKSYAKPVRSVVSMFMREARSLAKLRHPNIVGVHGAFEENGTAYMVLDLIDGPNLLEILESEPTKLSQRRVVDILLHLLDAIEKVHEIDLLHRDISPDNIIIDKSGAPVLIDFGAARADASRRTRTVSSMLVVKDGYSPQEFYVAGSEQAPCSDLYALAATFYHVLSGEAPPDSQARMIEIVGRRPDPCIPLAGRIDGYDQDFLKAIDRAMQIHPNDRLKSAAQWRNLISESIGDVQASGQSKADVVVKGLDLELERSLSRLVEETNIEVRKSQLIEFEPTTKIPPTPQKRLIPDWVEEFNRETLEHDTARTCGVHEGNLAPHQTPDEAIEPGGDSADTPELKPIVKTEINWIDRAQKKHERMCIERERGRENVASEAEQLADDSMTDNLPSPSEGLPIEATKVETLPRRKNWWVGILACLIICFCAFFFLESRSIAGVFVRGDITKSAEGHQALSFSIPRSDIGAIAAE